MVRLILSLLVIVIIVLATVLFIKDDPGFLLVKYREYSLETSLAFGVIAVAVLVSVLHLLLKLIRVFWKLPRSMKLQSQSRRHEKSRRLLNQGLIDLAEGRFEQSERNLIKLVDYSESPLLHYLAAARAAQQQGKHDQRDTYLKAAHEAQPEAEIAIGVTQAELQLSHHQIEQALATLTHLRNIAPKHDHVLKLLARMYFEQKDWNSLSVLLPDVRNKKLIKASKLKVMELATYQGCLEAAAESSDLGSLDLAWVKIPRAMQMLPDLALFYIDLNQKSDRNNSKIETLIIKSLDREWDDRMIDRYGLYESAEAAKQLEKAETWLSDYGENAHLLLALGRICIRAKLWGKAQGYLEASIGIERTGQNCLAIAELFDIHLQQPEKAAEYYQLGLRHCAGS
ncbi:MAG: HemY protein [Gammaproteobacteria bacterium]|jgi:HemY protein